LVDDLRLLEHRHAGEADVGQEAADVGVDLVLVDQLGHLAAADVGLGLVVLDEKLDRAPVDAAVGVDAVDRHLQTDHRGLAADGRGARQRLLGADLEGLLRPERGPPRGRHQHGGAERAGRRAVTDQAAARDFSGIPELIVVVAIVVGHDRSLCSFPGGPVRTLSGWG